MYKIDSNFNINKISPNLSITDIDNNKKYDKIFIITEKRINDLFSKHKIFDLGFHQITINDSKDIKTLHSVKLIINDLMNANATRDSLLIGLGGGSISDIVGFIASIYMRGIDHVFMPTTLLGMVDASIGGKTGVDFLGVKNLVGTFKQPEGIIIDFHFLDSLDSNYIIDGFAEIIKYGLIFDKVFFDKVFKNFNSLINKNDFKEIIIQACNYKIKTVLKDQFDQNQRMILNFGHTVGHALETYFSNDKISHGQAIYHGMIVESLVSLELGYLSKKDFQKIHDFLSSIITFPIKNVDEKAIYKLIKHDKKQLRNKMHFVILKQIGDSIIKSDVDPDVIINSIKKVLR
tara:strand:+ start:420 stop:1460 length:1041 start_codon:yes stop_codon:yes gene_type:complete